MMNACGFSRAQGDAQCPLRGVCRPRARKRRRSPATIRSTVNRSRDAREPRLAHPPPPRLVLSSATIASAIAA